MLGCRGQVLKRIGGVLVLVVAGLLAAVASAEEMQPLQTLQELVEQGQYERAYELGLALEAEHEGRPRFDFHHGLAALETGRYAEAIFALERVVLVRPEQLRVRLELARAHFLAGNYGAAEREFERVMATDPPASVKANIRRFTDRIEQARSRQRRDLSGWLALGGGHDSNINSATSDSIVNTPIGDFELVRSGQEISDEFARIELGGRWREPLTKVSNLDLMGSFEHKENASGGAFDLGVARVNGGYTREFGANRLRVGARLQQVWLDDSQFQHSYGVMLTLDRALAPGWIGSLTGALTAVRYPDDALRETNQYLLSVAVMRSHGALTQTFSVYGADEPAVDDGPGSHNGRYFVGGMYQLRYDAGDLQPFLRLGLQRARYDAAHPVFVSTRRDRTASAALGTDWRLGDALQLSVELNWTDVDSNLPIFDYDRILAEAGLRLQL